MVGVLVLVDEHVAEPAPVVLRDVGERLEQVHRGHDQVVEVERVGLEQPPLVERVGLGQRLLQVRLGAPGEGLVVDQLVLEVADLGGERPRRVALRVQVEVAADQGHQALRVGLVVDGEGRLHAQVRRLPTQDAHARRVERADPHDLGAPADECRDALLHLAGGLVGEGDREHRAGVHVALAEQVGDPVREHPGLPGAGAGDDQQRTPCVLDRCPLLRVEAFQQPGRVAPALAARGRGCGGRVVRPRRQREGVVEESAHLPSSLGGAPDATGLALPPPPDLLTGRDGWRMGRPATAPRPPQTCSPDEAADVRRRRRLHGVAPSDLLT